VVKIQNKCLNIFKKERIGFWFLRDALPNKFVDKQQEPKSPKVHKLMKIA